MVKEVIKKSSNILITSHLHPDGDALGSMLALNKAFKSLGKNVFLYNESCIPKIFMFLPDIDKIENRIPESCKFDAAFVLDCSDINRTGHCTELLKSIPHIINIDHHVTNSKFGTSAIIDPKACATAEIIYGLIKKMNISICKDIAYSIYTGIFTDTGSFRFSNTTQSAFSICKEMIKCGVRPHKVARQVYGSYSLGRIKLINMVLDSIEISKNGKMSLMMLTQEMLNITGTEKEDVSELINYAEHIEDVKIAALIKESDKKSTKSECYHVSLRSNGSVDVSAIAYNYGGGGHVTAAGFTTFMPFGQLKKEMFSLAEKI